MRKEHHRPPAKSFNTSRTILQIFLEKGKKNTNSCRHPNRNLFRDPAHSTWSKPGFQISPASFKCMDPHTTLGFGSACGSSETRQATPGNKNKTKRMLQDCAQEFLGSKRWLRSFTRPELSAHCVDALGRVHMLHIAPPHGWGSSAKAQNRSLQRRTRTQTK